MGGLQESRATAAPITYHNTKNLDYLLLPMRKAAAFSAGLTPNGGVK